MPTKNNTPAPRSTKRALVYLLSFVLALAIVATVEYVAVSLAYDNMARRATLDAWQCGGSIQANRRAADPVYVQPEPVAEPSDSFVDELINDSLDHHPHAPAAEADSI